MIDPNPPPLFIPQRNDVLTLAGCFSSSGAGRPGREESPCLWYVPPICSKIDASLSQPSDMLIFPAIPSHSDDVATVLGGASLRPAQRRLFLPVGPRHGTGQMGCGGCVPPCARLAAGCSCIKNSRRRRLLFYAPASSTSRCRNSREIHQMAANPTRV